MSRESGPEGLEYLHIFIVTSLSLAVLGLNTKYTYLENARVFFSELVVICSAARTTSCPTAWCHRRPG